MDSKAKSKNVVEEVREAIKSFIGEISKEKLKDGRPVTVSIHTDRSIVKVVPCLSPSPQIAVRYVASHRGRSGGDLQKNGVSNWIARVELFSAKNINDSSQKTITERIAVFFDKVETIRITEASSTGSSKPSDTRDELPQVDWLTADGKKDPKHLLPFLVLAVTRRPRSYVGVRNLWSEYLPFDWSILREKKKTAMDAALKDLTEEQEVVRLMQGGFYWIPHRLHRKAYKVLTEPVRGSTLKEAKTPQSWCAIFQRLAFLAMIHARQARFYYLHVFQRTRDTNAMFEYLYHRVSSLKYLSLLCDVIKWDVATRALSETNELKAKKKAARETHTMNNAIIDESTIYSDNGKAMPWDSAIRAIACLFAVEGYTPSEREWEDNQLKVQVELGRVRTRWMQAFNNVFEREMELFHSQGSAETWLAWIEQILDHDLVSIAPRKTDGSEAGAEQKGSDNNELQKQHKKIQRSLEHLQASLLREKRDWTECAKKRIEHLKGVLTEIKVVIGKQERNLADKLGQLCRAAPNELVSMLVGDSLAKDLRNILDSDEPASKAAGKEVAVNSDQRKRFMRGTAIGTIAESINVFISMTQHSETAAELTRLLESLEDVARCLFHDSYIEIEHIRLTEVKRAPRRLLAIAAILAHRILAFDRIAKKLSRQSYSEFQNWEVRLTFERIRLKYGERDLWIGNEPYIDNEEPLHQACRDLEKARHHTRGSDSTNPIEFPLQRCRLRTLQAKLLTRLKKCQEARLSLSHAETGLTEETMQQRFLLAVVAEFRAQTWMREAADNLEAFETGEKSGFDSGPQQQSSLISRQVESSAKQRNSAKDEWKKANGFLSDAGQALRDAERLLQRGRRNVGQWLRLYGTKAQLEIENLLLMLFELNTETPFPPERGELHFRAQIYGFLHRGLEAIRGGWHCVQTLPPILEEAEFEQHERSPWLAKWAQLMITGYLVLKRLSRVLGAVQDDIDEKFDLHTRVEDSQQYVDLWLALNESVGLDRFLELHKQTGREWVMLLAEAAKVDTVLSMPEGYAERIASSDILKRRPVRRWRQRAIDVVKEMVEDGAMNEKQIGSSANQTELRKAYKKWHGVRIRGNDETITAGKKNP